MIRRMQRHLAVIAATTDEIHYRTHTAIHSDDEPPVTVYLDGRETSVKVCRMRHAYRPPTEADAPRVRELRAKQTAAFRAYAEALLAVTP